MKTNDEILEKISCCTISEDVDLDIKENFYYKYSDVIAAMNEAREQMNVVTPGIGESLHEHIVINNEAFSEVTGYEDEQVICDRCGHWSLVSDVECEFCKQTDC